MTFISHFRPLYVAVLELQEEVQDSVLCQEAKEYKTEQAELHFSCVTLNFYINLSAAGRCNAMQKVQKQVFLKFFTS